MDERRAQCKMEDIPVDHPAYAPFQKIAKLLPKMLEKAFGDEVSQMNVGNIVILRSLPFGQLQETHLDMDIFEWDKPFANCHYFGMLALQDKMKIAINWSATDHYRIEKTSANYKIPPAQEDIQKYSNPGSMRMQ